MSSRPPARTRVLIYLPAMFFAVAGAIVWASRLFAGGNHDTRRHPHVSIHGGVVQPLGNRHLELVADTEGVLHLFMLGQDETVLQPAPISELRGHAQVEDGSTLAPISLDADPLPGDPAGKTSRYTGRFPPGLTRAPGSVSLTVPLDGRVYRARFDLRQQPDQSSHAEDPPMPEAAAGEDQRRLYRTPGGGYTAADIRANGAAPPAEKYGGILPRHDLRPEPGDRICPITRTRANPRFAWTVGGKRYLFCCPPCIDEFVLQVRRDPGSIRQPEAYVKE